MTYTVVTFYQFIPLMNYPSFREPLRQVCSSLDLKGTILVASEGINGTVAGSRDAIAAFVGHLNDESLFSGRLDSVELKFSTAFEMPFRKLKVRLKKEIVTLGDRAVDPVRQSGAHVSPMEWNALLETPDILLIDTRNQFEVAMGTFEGAIDPRLVRFSDFRMFVDHALEGQRQRPIALFCTGGIRCEKASSYMLSRGFETVYQLKGGILKYLEQIPEMQSRWVGTCFVFDERIALGHGLAERRRNELAKTQ